MKTAALGLATLIIVALGPGVPAPVAAAPFAFDGTWDVTLTCPPLRDDEDDAKGYIQRFRAR